MKPIVTPVVSRGLPANFDDDFVSELDITYVPNRFEDGWLLQALGAWFADGTLVDVLGAVRGGKEANVYCCRGGPSQDGRLLAAKVYRPRKFRELSNDAIYREGRALVDARGNARKARDRRIRRAVDKGSRIGKQASHTSWVMHEYLVLQQLSAAGARVPHPVAASSDAVLMDFVGDDEGAAPTLDRVRPDPDDVPRLLDEALEVVEVLLRAGWVHGDLSAYNLLYWEDHLTVIDLPQVADVYRNPHATGLFLRDVERVCHALGRVEARERADTIWDRVIGGPVPDVALASHPPEGELDDG